jgi:cytochrome c peroxidase
VGIGGQKGTRNAPAILNRCYGQSFFWDGRVHTLEEQALHPIHDPKEMNLRLDELIARLRSDSAYRWQFQRAFPDGVSTANVAQALASFVRTLRSGDSAYDRFEQGDHAALSAEARRGLELFRGKANCTACHIGPNFTDEQFHNTGVSWGKGDLGRFTVTQEEKDRGAFKTPTLREITRTAPSCMMAAWRRWRMRSSITTGAGSGTRIWMKSCGRFGSPRRRSRSCWRFFGA